MRENNKSSQEVTQEIPCPYCNKGVIVGDILLDAYKLGKQEAISSFAEKIIKHIDLRNKQLIDNNEGISQNNMLKTMIYQEMKLFIEEELHKLVEEQSSSGDKK